MRNDSFIWKELLELLFVEDPQVCIWVPTNDMLRASVRERNQQVFGSKSTTVCRERIIMNWNVQANP